MLDTRRLSIFTAVAEEGSFTAAADRLYLTQSAVSQQMAILEREIGLTLMERLPRGIRLTPAGQLLAERTRSLLIDLSSIEQEMHRLTELPKRVRLGTFATAGAHLIPLVVQQYRQQHRDAQLVVTACQPADLADQLLDGSIHVGLWWDYDFAPRADQGLQREHLLDDPLLVLLPAGHPAAEAADGDALRLKDLAAEPWVARSHDAPYDVAFESMCRICGFEPDIVFRTEDYQSIQGLVAAGIGVGVVPRLSLMAQRADVVARPFVEPAFSRRIGALTLPEARRDPMVVQLLDVLERAALEINEERPKED